MFKSTLQQVLDTLTRAARARGLNDTAWAAAAGFSKETLSRLRRRSSCDLSTLVALAEATGAELTARFAQPASSADGHFPLEVPRDYERQLLALASSGNLNAATWAAAGPKFFMAGLAVMLAGNAGADRRGLLSIAEDLHPGASEVAVFALWLKRSPLRPSRFLPMLAQARHAA